MINNKVENLVKMMQLTG